MAILAEFDKKIDDTTTKLETLLNEASKIKNVNDLLVARNDHHVESNKLLKSLHDDLKAFSTSISAALEELSSATAAVRQSDPSRVIEELEAKSKELQDQHLRLEQGIDKVASTLGEKTNTIQKHLLLQTEEIGNSKKSNQESLEKAIAAIGEHVDKGNKALGGKVNAVLALAVINLMSLAGVAFLLLSK